MTRAIKCFVKYCMCLKQIFTSCNVCFKRISLLLHRVSSAYATDLCASSPFPLTLSFSKKTLASKLLITCLSCAVNSQADIKCL